MNEPDYVDARVLRAAAEAVGALRLAELLVIFEARIGWLSDALAGTSGDPAALLAALHKSRGSAASVGFTGLGRALAEIERRLDPDADHAAHVTSRLDVPGNNALPLFELGSAMRAAWQASLVAAVLHVPELHHHRPCGSKR